MAKPVYITQKLVFDAATRLLENGTPFVEISTTKLRKELGRGSPNDILPFLQEWKQKQVEDNGLNVDIPDEFKDELYEFGSKLWKMAARITAQKNSQQYEDYHLVKNELAESHDEMGRIDDELSTYKENLSKLSDELLLLKEDIAVIHGKLQMLSEPSEQYKKMAENEMFEIKNKIQTIIETHLSRKVTLKTNEELPAS